jgi:hypothetical protein
MTLEAELEKPHEELKRVPYVHLRSFCTQVITEIFTETFRSRSEGCGLKVKGGFGSRCKIVDCHNPLNRGTKLIADGLSSLGIYYSIISCSKFRFDFHLTLYILCACQLPKCKRYRWPPLPSASFPSRRANDNKMR